MSLQLQIEEMSDYLIARFTGPGAAEEVWHQYESIAERCKRANKNKLLLDFLEAHGSRTVAFRGWPATKTCGVFRDNAHA